MTRVFVTGGSGLVGGALVTRLVERGDEVVALARTEASRRQARARRGATAALGATCSTRPALDRRDATAASSLYHVAGINTFCPIDPAPLFHVNVRGAETAVRAAAPRGRSRAWC